MITNETSLTDLAAMVSGALERQGIIATLSGGGAVSIYTKYQYVSEDLDFVTVAVVEQIKQHWSRSGSSELANHDYRFSITPTLTGIWSFPLRR